MQPHTLFTWDFIDQFKPSFQEVRRPKKGSLFAGNHRASVDKSSSLQEKKHIERRHRKKARQSSLLNHSTPQTQMKTNIIPSLRRTLFVACASVAIPLQAQAQIASDNASNAAYSGAVWTTGSNGGTGFGNWTITSSGGASGFAGSFIGSTGLSSTSFGLYSGNDAGAFSNALRPFAGGVLLAGQTFSVNLGHTPTIDGEIGLQLRSSGTSLIVLKFVSGQSNWQLWDGGSSDFSAGQAYAPDTSLAFSFTYNGGNSYSYTFGSGSGINNTATNTLTGINEVLFYDNNQGASQNFGFNNLSIVPEPSTWILIGIGSAFLLWRIRRKDYAGS